MSKKKLDGTWPAWLKENLDRKCDPEQLLGILLKNGFGVDSIKDHMGTLFPAGSALLKGTAHANDGPNIDYDVISKPRLTHKDSGLNVLQMVSDKLQLYVLDGFMSDEECDRIVEISAKHLRPSTVTTGDRDKGYRTSSTSDLSLLNEPYVAKIDEKIARTLGIRLPYSEGIQAQRYEVGQEFKQHTDYFQPGTGEYATFAGSRGQRTWTFMVYLNDGMKGGGTKFFAIDKIFNPKKGTAVIWNNLHPDGEVNPNTMHSGMPVESGHKIIITKWFRDRGNGPMFYEDQ
jgi:prolyl 4-hydroxylase